MSDPNVGQRVAANWEAVVKTKPEDQINNDYWLFNRLSKGDGFKGLNGGDFIVGPIEYVLNSTVASYSDLDTISTNRVDVFDRYEYQWKEYAGTVAISDLEADRNSGDGMVFDLLPAKLENLRNTFRSTLNTDMFGLGTSNSSKVVEGLQKLVSVTPTTGTVGAINRASANSTFWRNQQTSGAQTTSAFDNLRAAMRSIYNLCSNGVGDQHPTFGVTTRTVFEGFEGLLLANERFDDKSTGDGGFKNEVLKFKGALLSYDVACPSGDLFFLNEQFLKLVYKSGSWMKAQSPIRPANQTVDTILIRSMCNLIATQPRRLGVVSSIT
jgi:hypothetical protein